MTDIVLPGMSGPELVRRLRVELPGLRVLCMSGFTDDHIARHGLDDLSAVFLQKPFTPDTLRAKVQEALDAQSHTRAERLARDVPGQDE